MSGQVPELELLEPMLIRPRPSEMRTQRRGPELPSREITITIGLVSWVLAPAAFTVPRGVNLKLVLPPGVMVKDVELPEGVR